jgi:hypothetical protein
MTQFKAWHLNRQRTELSSSPPHVIRAVKEALPSQGNSRQSSPAPEFFASFSPFVRQTRIFPVRRNGALQDNAAEQERAVYVLHKRDNGHAKADSQAAKIQHGEVIWQT